jgi:hypothetical protein
MNLADAVDGRCAANREARHVEDVTLLGRATEIQQLVDRDAELCRPALELPCDEVRREHIMTGRDGRVRGRYPSATEPQDKGLLADIAEAL